MTVHKAYAGARTICGLVPVVATAFAMAVLLWQSSNCSAHEVRPSYLELREDRAELQFLGAAFEFGAGIGDRNEVIARIMRIFSIKIALHGERFKRGS